MRQNAPKKRHNPIKPSVVAIKIAIQTTLKIALHHWQFIDKLQLWRGGRGLRSATLVAFMGGMSLSGQVAQAATVTDVNSLVSQAVTTHPLVGAARAEEQATAEGVNAARLNLYPQPSISSNYDKNDGVISRIGVRQPLWTGGKLTANVNQAIYDDKAAMAYVFEQQNTVAKNTIDVWQNYIYAVALKSLYVNNLNQLNEFETMMTRRVEQGVSASIDLNLVKNRILQDQNAYQAAMQQERIAIARLSQMIGEPLNNQGINNIPLNEMAKYVKSQSSDFEKLAFSQASFNNPSVIKQQFQIEAAKQQVKAQQAAQYPTVYAQYEQLYYHRDNKSDGQFSLGLSYDPGAGFSNMALARASQARVQSLAQSQEAARRTVMEDIQTQYQQFVSAKDQETSLITAVAGAQIVVDSYRRQFIAGRKTWLEVLNAVREKSGYQQQLLQIQSQMLAAFYKLQVDFGRMPWQNNSLLYQPVSEFHPYQSFEEWLKQQSEKLRDQPIRDNLNDNLATASVTDTSQPLEADKEAVAMPVESSTKTDLPSQNSENSLNTQAINTLDNIPESNLDSVNDSHNLPASQPPLAEPPLPTPSATTTPATEANSAVNTASEATLPLPVIPLSPVTAQDNLASQRIPDIATHLVPISEDELKNKQILLVVAVDKLPPL